MPSSALQKYTLYRSVGRALHSKIMEKSLREDVLNRAASLLGILSGKTLLFKNEDETGTLMDFALHDILADGKRNTIEIYRDEVGWENELEREILDALIASRTSLFRIFAVAHDEHTLYLHDLLSKAGPPSPENNIGSLIGRKLVDVNLSQTASPGLLMFTRLVPIREDLNMTSGAGFLFPGELQEFLKKRHQVIARKFKDGNEAARRYVAFYRLNKPTAWNRSSSEDDCLEDGSLPSRTFGLHIVIVKDFLFGNRGEGGAIFTYYFGIILTAHELVRMSVNSSSPVDFCIYLDNRTGYDTQTLSNEVVNYGHLLANSTGIMRYDNQMRSEGGGLYIFELSVRQLLPIATATLDVQRLSN